VARVPGVCAEETGSEAGSVSFANSHSTNYSMLINELFIDDIYSLDNESIAE
jgi:hypothetical protein